MNIIEKKEKYREFYETMDEIIKETNPCDVKIENGIATCRRSRRQNDTTGVLCCGGCKHLSMKKGCKVKSLACKIWFCPDAIKSLIEKDNEIDSIAFLGFKSYINNMCDYHNIPLYHRCSLKENFKEL